MIFRGGAAFDMIVGTHKSLFPTLKNSERPIALTISGSDPGGGAGLQADLKTFAALGVYGYSVLTQVIAQNSTHVTDYEHASEEIVRHQLETLLEESMPLAMKTGALANFVRRLAPHREGPFSRLRRSRRDIA
jgi:hypothetical protein